MNPERSFGNGRLNRFVDVDELVASIGLDEEEIAWRKEFVGFDEADERRLADLESLLDANADQIADEFYENLLEHEEAHAIVDRSPKGVEALKRTQSAYLVSLATGTYDQAYFKNRARIGKLHELLDMPLKQYLGQYGVYYELLLTRLSERVQRQVVDAAEEWAHEREEAESESTRAIDGLIDAFGFGDGGEGRPSEDELALERSFEEAIRAAIDDGMMDVLALLRIINLDLQIAVDTYVDSYARDLERATERRRQLAYEVESDVQAPIEELYDASELVANRAESISGHAANQASAVNRVSGELEEQSAAVEEIASTADEVRSESARTERLAAAGVESADDALDDLEAIDEAAEQTETAVERLEERIDEIDEVVSRLESLSERTGLLATNAKIESTRSDAGDATMGVIADEVRTFAERTKQDLTSIQEAVEGVRADAVATIEATEETVDRVDDGTDSVRQTVDSLEAIHESAQSTAAGMEDVATATDQQARSLEVTAETVGDVSTAADRIADATESLAAASQEQTASLRDVGDTVGRLTDDPEPEPPVYERIE
ncbi:globin-coupled sensor protein [Natrialba sp. INN-245]|uniref:globin-coupled sensor protein n=1 Tax=Natrialba sp. INN-245 TaxID=2690967 RepID=UPI0013115591|nr:globin-coupled sensor protein [Natrialba sp. INN-245]MWV40352.1 chemotaxis protein [Natrialba sp. INN-245]